MHFLFWYNTVESPSVIFSVFKTVEFYSLCLKKNISVLAMHLLEMIFAVCSDLEYDPSIISGPFIFIVCLKSCGKCFMHVHGENNLRKSTICMIRPLTSYYKGSFNMHSVTLFPHTMQSYFTYPTNWHIYTSNSIWKTHFAARVLLIGQTIRRMTLNLP